MAPKAAPQSQVAPPLATPQNTSGHTQAEIKAARTRLPTWGVELTQENINKYIILRRLEEETDPSREGRVTKNKFFSTGQVRRYEEATIRILYVVPKVNHLEPEVDRFIRDDVPAHCFVRPELLATRPSDIDCDAHWFLTRNVDHLRLGALQREHRTAILNVTEVPSDSNSSGPPALPPSGSSSSGGSGSAPSGGSNPGAVPRALPLDIAPPVSTAPNQEPEQQLDPRYRPLLARRSNEDDKPIKDEFEDIAKKTQTAAAAGAPKALAVSD